MDIKLLQYYNFADSEILRFRVFIFRDVQYYNYIEYIYYVSVLTYVPHM